MAEMGIPVFSKDIKPNYNVSPSFTLVIAISGLEFIPAEWGILPPWADKAKFKGPLINARSETIWEKPSFRHLIKSKRAIIPVNGFYEWKREKGSKQAFYFKPANDPAFALAGIYQIPKDGVPQCCIITTEANKIMGPVHHRMPVLLARRSFEKWLGDTSHDDITTLMKPSPQSWIKCHPVTNYVNNARNQGEECVTPLNGQT